MKKIFKYLGIFFLVIIMLLIGVGVYAYTQKDKIFDQAKIFANEYLNATVDFDNDQVGISIFSSFPHLTVEMGHIRVTGKEEFEGIRLVDIGSIDLTVDIMSVLSGNYSITGINLNDSKFYVKVLRNGKANYDIVKSDGSAVEETTIEETSGEPLNFKLALNHYAFRNIDLIYDDAPMRAHIEVKNFNHEGSGNFTESTYDLYTKTLLEALTVKYEGVRYFNKTNIELDFNANIEMTDKAINIRLLENMFRLNAMKLHADGTVNMLGDDIAMDLKFDAPDTKFSSVLSLIPSAFTKDFKDVKTKGEFAFDAFVKGKYTASGALPTFGLNLEMAGGEFQYPDLPMAVKDVATKIEIISPSSDLDDIFIDIEYFHIKVGNNPFDAKLILKTPMSDPNIDAGVKGTLNLEEIAQAFPMEGVETLNGIINADLLAKTRMSYIDKEEYDKVEMQGNLGVQSMNYAAAGLPTVLINEVKMNFTPNNVLLENFDIKIGKSDLQANGTLDNLLTYFSKDKVLTGNLDVHSSLLDLDEMMQGSETEATELDTATTVAATDMVDTTSAGTEEEVFNLFKFSASIAFDKIAYENYNISQLKTSGSFSPAIAKLDNFEMLLGDIDFKASGELEHVFGYVFDNQTLIGHLKVNSENMNVNPLMATLMGEETTTEPATEAAATTSSDTVTAHLQFPDKIDFTFDAGVKNFTYETYNLKNVLAHGHLKNQVLEITKLSADVFGGSVAMNGEFDTRDPNKPGFKFGYDLSKLSFQNIAEGVGMASTLAPILKAFDGTFDSKLHIDGVLDGNLSPNLKSINIDGVLETYNAVIEDYEPLKKLSEKVKLKSFEKINLSNTKNFFKMKDGVFTVEEFPMQIAGMDVTIGGNHSLDQNMDYEMKLSVPRELLGSGALGAAANQALDKGLDMFKGQASKLGINLAESDKIDIGVDITGNMNDPKYKVKLLGASKSGQSLGDGLKESLKAEAERLRKEAEERAKAEAERLKKELEDKAKAEADRLKNEAEARAKAEAERLKNEAEARAKAEAERLKNETAERLLRDQRAQAIKDSLDRLAREKLKNTGGGILNGGGFKNPFKKK